MTFLSIIAVCGCVRAAGAAPKKEQAPREGLQKLGNWDPTATLVHGDREKVRGRARGSAGCARCRARWRVAPERVIEGIFNYSPANSRF
ncbi:hypothetical protein F5884DRAFT_301804 [Xylogone sp. PMI_703]|nr:hypothetical protein F5884DRAFT_301804 [Xylogone sp. PMI_703]